MIAKCISAKGYNNCVSQLEGCSLAELRIDLNQISVNELELLLATNAQFIVTCRPGTYSDTERIDILKAAAQMGAHYIDIETETDADLIGIVKTACITSGTKLIVSYHNFEHTPEPTVLENIISECIQQGADYVKIACMVNTPTDNAVLLGLHAKHRNMIAFGMGEMGRISRLASVFCGAPFTYVAPDKNGETAPAQYTYTEMEQLMKMAKLIN